MSFSKSALQHLMTCAATILLKVIQNYKADTSLKCALNDLVEIENSQQYMNRREIWQRMIFN